MRVEKGRNRGFSGSGLLGLLSSKSMFSVCIAYHCADLENEPI